MTKEITLKLNGITKSFQSDAIGLFDLNHVWEQFNLNASVHPDNWNEPVFDELVANGVIIEQAPEEGGLLGFKTALINYAAWADENFWDYIFETFANLVDGKAPSLTEIRVT